MKNPCEDIQFIGSIDEKLLIMKKDGSYVLTKSGNLAKENYEDMNTKNEYQYVDGEININCSNYITVCSKDFIEVDPNKKYYEAVNVKSSNAKATYLIGIFEYDADYNLIVPENVSEVNGSLTYLERYLNYGDTEVYLNNIQGFTGEKDTNKGFIIWNYKNSEGYQYPVQTYSRNIFNNLWDSKDEAFDFENNIIKLKSPWNSNTVSKGTMLSQRETAKTYNYGVGSMVKFTDQYKYRENYLQGSKTIRDEWKDTKFRQGTKYIKILFLINYDSVQDVTTSIKDVIFAECE